jgi:hypothetical protein
MKTLIKFEKSETVKQTIYYAIARNYWLTVGQTIISEYYSI